MQLHTNCLVALGLALAAAAPAGDTKAVQPTIDATVQEENVCSSRDPYAADGGHHITCGTGCHVHQKSSASANGCGSGGASIPDALSNVRDMFTMACNFHDVCYARCVEGLTQKQCDDVFYRLMNDIMLEKMPTDDSYKEYLNHHIQSSAMDMYATVRGSAGSAAFRDAVGNRCECKAEPQETPIDSSWHEWLDLNLSAHHFLAHEPAPAPPIPLILPHPCARFAHTPPPARARLWRSREPGYLQPPPRDDEPDEEACHRQ